MWWGPQGRLESQEHQNPGIGAPGRWGSAPLCPGNAPQSRSRWGLPEDGEVLPLPRKHTPRAGAGGKLPEVPIWL